MNIRDLQSEIKKLGENIKAKLAENEKQLEKRQKNKKLLAENSKLKELEAQLFTKDGRYQKPMLISQISYLSSMLNSADQRPGKDAYERYEALKKQYDSIFD